MKQKTYFECKNCGYHSPKWLGKCPECGEWESFVEVTEKPSAPGLAGGNAKKSNTAVNIRRLSEISTDNNYRIPTEIKELDRILGGGIVPGSLILIGGDPGIGKSTLMLQMCSRLHSYKALYISGEESIEQIKLRAVRLDSINGDIEILCETNIEAINSAILASDARVIVLDSIQSVYTEHADSTPGSLLQVRECASLLMQTVKSTGKTIFLVGHITKDGMIAGPKILEHLVDTVLQFEGDKTHSYRILRSLKNRYGSTNEIGIFEMQADGMHEVKNPSELFLGERNSNDPGIAITTSIEGTRPILLEVQALVTASGYGVPQRNSNGFDQRRLQMILSVLEKRLGLPFSRNDVFINIAGGLYVADTAVDFAIAMALVSSLKDEALDMKSVFIGEIGLTGEIRRVSSLEQRINECLKLGFTDIYMPGAANYSKNIPDAAGIHFADRISVALSMVF